MGKSTGPRTPRGKARSSQNAAKHWIESGRILPQEEKEAAILRQGFMEHFNPEGLVENDVIADFVFNRLIRRRIDVAFTREFSKASAMKPLIQLENHEDTAIQFYLRSNLSRRTPPGEHGARLRPDLCIAGLEALRDNIHKHGPRPEIDLVALGQCFGMHPTEHGALLISNLTEIVEGTDTRDQDELKEWILEGLEIEIERQKYRSTVATKLEAIELASDIQEPGTPELDKLLRYRAANNREFKDLLDSLQRIQNLRRSAA
jgi:hypothetical protein